MYSVGKEVCVVNGICGGIHMVSGSLVFMEWHIHSLQIRWLAGMEDNWK